MTSFNKKKEEAQAHLDMVAREKALKQLGIEDRFEFADHAKIYNAEHGRFHSAQSKCSVFRQAALLHHMMRIASNGHQMAPINLILQNSRPCTTNVTTNVNSPRACGPESARRRSGTSGKAKRWPPDASREGRPRRLFEATEVIEFLLRILFCRK